LKIPKTVKAFGRSYRIIRDNETTNKMECWGYLDAMRDIIMLRERDLDFTSGHEKQVFFHELMHVVDNNFHVGLTEEQIQTMSVGMVTIIEDNQLDFKDEK
jgi:hypothetical protein